MFSVSPVPQGIGLNVLVGMGSRGGVGRSIPRFRLVYIPNHSLLLSLESLEKFLCGGWWWWVCKPILVFSLSIRKAFKRKKRKYIGTQEILLGYLWVT